MVPRVASRTKSTALRLFALTAVVVGIYRLGAGGPTYAVKGTWEGAPNTLQDIVKGDLSSLVKGGLEPQFNLPTVKYNKEGLALSVEDGRLNADYTGKFDTDKTLNLHIDDNQAWRAGLSSGETTLNVKGQGMNLDDLSWDASQTSSVAGVGDIKVEYNSDKEYNLTVAREKLAQIAGFQVDGKARATHDGVTGRLAARRQLPGKAQLSYSVENPVGIYDVAQSTHVGELSVPVAGGDAALRVEGDSTAQKYVGSYARAVQGGHANFKLSKDGDALGYNVSYARVLSDLMPVDAGVHVGADEAGVYGKVTARRNLGEDMGAEYEATGRYGVGEAGARQLAHSLKVSNKLGFAQLVHGTEQAPRLRVGYEFNA